MIQNHVRPLFWSSQQNVQSTDLAKWTAKEDRKVVMKLLRCRSVKPSSQFESFRCTWSHLVTKRRSWLLDQFWFPQEIQPKNKTHKSILQHKNSKIAKWNSSLEMIFLEPLTTSEHFLNKFTKLSHFLRRIWDSSERLPIAEIFKNHAK